MSLFMLLPTLFLLLLLLMLWRIVYNQHKRFHLLHTQLEEQSLLLTTLQGKEELNEQVFTEQQNKISSLEKNLTQVHEQYEQQLKSALQQIAVLKNEVEQLTSQQPEDKLYTRAFKLAALGADAEEISQTCEIPLAEAEMLLAIHQTKTD